MHAVRGCVYANIGQDLYLLSKAPVMQTAYQISMTEMTISHEVDVELVSLMK